MHMTWSHCQSGTSRKTIPAARHSISHLKEKHLERENGKPTSPLKKTKEREELERDDSMRKSSKVSKDSAKSESQNKRRSCDGCGGANHKRADCRLKKHPGFNESSVKWEENTKAKDYLRNCKSEKSIIASFLLKKKNSTGIPVMKRRKVSYSNLLYLL